VRLVGGF